jgi:hypothetical protein
MEYVSGFSLIFTFCWCVLMILEMCLKGPFGSTTGITTFCVCMWGYSLYCYRPWVANNSIVVTPSAALIPETGSVPRIVSVSCHVKSEAAKFVASLGLNPGNLSPEFDRCFCVSCYPAEWPDTISNQGPTPCVSTTACEQRLCVHCFVLRSLVALVHMQLCC